MNKTGCLILCLRPLDVWPQAFQRVHFNASLWQEAGWVLLCPSNVTIPLFLPEGFRPNKKFFRYTQIMGLRDKLLSKQNRPYCIFVGLWTLGALCFFGMHSIISIPPRTMASLPTTTVKLLLMSGLAFLVIGIFLFILAQVLLFRPIYVDMKRKRAQKHRQNAKLTEETPLPFQDGVWPPAPHRLPIIDSQSCDGNHDDPQVRDTQRSKKLPAIFFVGLWVVAILCFYIAITQFSAAHRGTEEIVLGVVHLVIGVVVLTMALGLSLQKIFLADKAKRSQNQIRDTDPQASDL